MKPTGVPDGSQEIPKVMRPRAIDREGRKDPNIADNLPEMKEGSEPMAESLRKGATGAPVNESAVPLEGGSQDVAKYGLARGPQGANS